MYMHTCVQTHVMHACMEEIRFLSYLVASGGDKASLACGPRCVCIVGVAWMSYRRMHDPPVADSGELAASGLQRPASVGEALSEARFRARSEMI